MSGELSSAETSTGTAGDRRDWVEFVRFFLDGESYGLELGRVRQILRDPRVDPVPQTGPAIAGVTNLGSDIPVVVDGRGLLGLPERPPDAEAVLFLLDRGDARPTGLLVDGVAGIEAYHVDDLAPPTDLRDWNPAIGRRWFRAAVVEPDGADGPTGVFDLEAIVAEARDRS